MRRVNFGRNYLRLCGISAWFFHLCTWYDPSAFFMLETRNTSTGTRRAETIVIHRQRDIMRLVNPLLSFSRTDRSQSTKSQENIKLPIRHMANTDHPMAKWAVSGIFSYLETLLNPKFWLFLNCGLDFWHFFLLTYFISESFVLICFGT